MVITAKRARRAASTTKNEEPVDARALDRRFLGRGGEADDVVIGRTEGAYVYDVEGRPFIDFVMGWCVGNLGWGREEIRERVRRFRGPEYVLPSMRYAPWGELARRLAALAPGKLHRSYRATGGTEAVEIALQLAMTATGRRKFVSIAGAYHGNSIAAKSIGSGAAELPGSLPGCLKLAPPLDGKKLARLERLLARRDVAALIMEPVIINLGALVPDDEFMHKVKGLCRRHGTLLIADEVATGFGRTGAMFASELFHLEPDVMCVAKALSSGHAPIGATLATEEVARKAERGGFSHYSTYGWHPLSVEAALATLDVLERDRHALLENVAARGGELEAGLRALDFGAPVHVQGRGLAIGLQFDDEDHTARLAERCRKEGVLVSAEDDVVLLFPPLNVDAATVEEALEQLARAVASQSGPSRP